MRRFLTLICLLCLAIPAGISISGCTRNPGANYCNGLGYGTKVGDVAVITLAPVTGGISIAYGQTRQISTPSAVTCKGAAASTGTFTYGTSNNQLVDISPSGNMCAGTWNRNSGGGIPNYTICTPPNPLPTTGGLPYSTAYVTASAESVVSNPVEIYVHTQVTAVSLVTQSTSGNTQQCFSQGQQAVLDGEACYGTAQNELCAPAAVVASSNYACPGGKAAGVTSIPNCTTALGELSYSVGVSTVASITTNTNTNQVTITAAQPGTTPITASVAGSGSSAGFFSTCPPASISVALANGSTSGTIAKGTTQNLTTTVTDTQGHTISGLNLDYQSTDPVDISASGGGAITTSFPGVASIYAVCQPGSCNAAPTQQIGSYGTGLPITSNKVTVTTPGTASDYLWFVAPGQSRYVVPVELLTGVVGSTTRLPYVPNSAVVDRQGANIYMGSDRELMVFSTASGSVTTQNVNVPGIVLATAPDGSQVLINNQQLHYFYLYNSGNNTYTTISGMGSAASWTPDARTLYITDSATLNSGGITGHTDKLYVYNQSTGWTTHNLPCSVYDAVACPSPSTGATNLAITIPSVGAYLSGTDTISHTWCPTGTVNNYGSLSFYPQADSINAQTDILAATTDGEHILGASLAGGTITLTDLGISIPTTVSPSGIATPIACPITTTGTSPNQVQTLNVLHTNPAQIGSISIPPASASATTINQLVTAPASNLAFITYKGTTALSPLPYYVPNANGTQGTLGYVQLTAQLTGSVFTAPLAGAFSPDGKYFFVSTAGDNMIHYISIPSSVSPATPPTDTQQIAPGLPACSPNSGLEPGCNFSGTGTVVPATFIAVKPRSTT